MDSNRPPCSHEDISSIFLNSETILFLHQIFYKGLQARMNNWPTLVLGNELFEFVKLFLKQSRHIAGFRATKSSLLVQLTLHETRAGH